MVKKASYGKQQKSTLNVQLAKPIKPTKPIKPAKPATEQLITLYRRSAPTLCYNTYDH